MATKTRRTTSSQVYPRVGLLRCNPMRNGSLFLPGSALSGLAPWTTLMMNATDKRNERDGTHAIGLDCDERVEFACRNRAQRPVRTFTMIAQLRASWRVLRGGRPGTRFQEFHNFRRKKASGPAARVLRIALGCLLVIAGVLAGLMPGPGGILVLVPGLALLASELLFVARWLDWCEPKIRKAWLHIKQAWTRAAIAARVAVCILGATLLALIALAVHAYTSSGV